MQLAINSLKNMLKNMTKTDEDDPNASKTLILPIPDSPDLPDSPVRSNSPRSPKPPEEIKAPPKLPIKAEYERCLSAISPTLIHRPIRQISLPPFFTSRRGSDQPKPIELKSTGRYSSPSIKRNGPNPKFLPFSSKMP